MGGAPSFKPFTRFFFFLFFHTMILVAEAAGDTARETPPSPSSLTLDDVRAGNSPPSLPSQNPNAGGKGSPFKPSVVVIVGVLTTVFSLTFLLLLYVKHCKPGDESSRNSNRGPVSVGRKNSGIDRTVVESLPIFRFGSLRGQKDGLECAVCLTPFEAVEVLRLLPKCKHAFHVECVDTWLDAHSTCPLCRYRVDPEDILLVEDAKVWPQNQPIPLLQENTDKLEQESDIEIGADPDPQTRVESNSILRRVSGRHSSVGERGGGGSGGFLQIILQQRGSVEGETTTQQKKTTMPFRRSLDSAISTKRKRNEGGREREGSSGGCDGPRKDGFLLTEKESKRRLEHRIIVSPSPKPKALHQRWSDVQPSDLLYLTSEMILSEDRRRLSSSSSRPSLSRQRQQQQQQQSMQLPLYRITVQENPNRREENRRGVMNLRSVSEITGLSRTRTGERQGQHHREEEEERQARVVSRWMAWISQTQRGVR